MVGRPARKKDKTGSKYLIPDIPHLFWIQFIFFDLLHILDIYYDLSEILKDIIYSAKTNSKICKICKISTILKYQEQCGEGLTYSNQILGSF